MIPNSNQNRFSDNRVYRSALLSIFITLVFLGTCLLPKSIYASNEYFRIDRIIKQNGPEGSYILVSWTLLQKWQTSTSLTVFPANAIYPSLNGNLPSTRLGGGFDSPQMNISYADMRSLGKFSDQDHYIWKHVGSPCNMAGPSPDEYTVGEQYTTRFTRIYDMATFTWKEASAITSTNDIRFTRYEKQNFDGSLCNMEFRTAVPDTQNYAVNQVLGVQNPAYNDTSLVQAYPSSSHSLGNKTPVILIHGIHGNRWVGQSLDNATGCTDIQNPQDCYPHYFRGLVEYLNNDETYNSRFKTYKFHYESDKFSARDIAKALEQRISSEFQDNREIIIIAHSMGGIIARHFLEGTKIIDGNIGHRGERVRQLITLATPHHGSQLANLTARAGLFQSKLKALGILSILDSAYWGGMQNCWGCVVNPQHYNRATLLWDNFDGSWDGNLSYGLLPWEKNQELPLANNYAGKITAYYGRIAPYEFFPDNCKNNPERCVNTVKSLYDDVGSSIVSRIIEGIKIANLSGFNLNPRNDGLVPEESGSFTTLSGQPPSVSKTIFCNGYNHRHMKDGHWRPCDNGKNLFKSILSDLSIPISVRRSDGRSETITTPGLLSGPEQTSFGYETFGGAPSNPAERERNVSFINLGDNPVQVNSLTLTGGNADQFVIVNTPPVPFSVPANGSTDVTVRFTPTTTGEKWAELKAVNNSSNNSVSVLLSGFGMPVSCDMIFAAQGRYIPAMGGSGSFTIGNIGCPWTISTSDTWIHPNVVGNAVNFTVDGNATGVNRSGIIEVSVYGRKYPFSISQDSAGAGCWLNMTDESADISSNGESNRFYVITPDACDWEVQSGAPWITVAEPGNFQGARTINYSAALNNSAVTRYGTVVFERQGDKKIFTVTQLANLGGENCNLNLSSSSQSIPAEGGANTVSLTTGNGCQWKLEAADRWLKILSANNGVGNTLINYSGNPNEGNSATRYGVIRITGNGRTAELSISQTGALMVYPHINLPVTVADIGNALINTNIYQTFIVKNVGSSVLNISDISRGSGSTDFTLLPYNDSVLPSESTALTVKFTATSTGTRSATFAISSNDPNASQSEFTVTGTGINASGNQPQINMPVRHINFGSVSAGSIGEKEIEIQNIGNSLLTVNSIQRVAGSSNFMIHRMPLNMNGGESQNFRIRYIPSTSGTQTAMFRISTNDPATVTVDFTVNGTGQAVEPNNENWQSIGSFSLDDARNAANFTIRNSKAYVTRFTDSNDISLNVIDINTGNKLANIPIDGFQTASPQPFIEVYGTKAYVALKKNGAEGKLAVINLSNKTTSYVDVGNEPKGVASDGSKIFVGNDIYFNDGSPSTIKVINASDNTVSAEISVGFNPAEVVYDPNTAKIYVANSAAASAVTQLKDSNSNKSLSIIDPANNTVTAIVPLQYNPYSIAVIGNRAFVSTGSTVEIIDLNSNMVVKSIPVPDCSRKIAAVNNYLFLTNNCQSIVTVIRAETGEIVASLKVEAPDAEVALDINTGIIYVLDKATRIVTGYRLIVPAFSVVTSNQMMASPRGNSTSLRTTISSIDGWTGPVALSCEGLPTGAKCNFAQNPVELPANGIISIDGLINIPFDTVPGPYNFRVIGSSSGQPATNSQTNVRSVVLIVSVCEYLLSTIQPINIGAAGGSGNINLSGTAGCGWVAESNASWLRVTSGQSGNGNGTIGFTVDPNIGLARSAILTIAGQTITVNQSLGCSYGLSAGGQTIGGGGGPGSFEVNTSSGCVWEAIASDPWITITSGTTGNGNGVVAFTVAPNTGPARFGTITIGGQIFTLNQETGCSFLLSSTNININASGGQGNFNINSGSNCAWSVTSNNDWINVISGGSGTGPGTVFFSVQPNSGAPRIGTLNVAGQDFTVNQTSIRQTPFDFEGDGKTDIAIFRPSVSEWWYQKSSDLQVIAGQFGTPTDKIAPSDFTGDGKTDITVWRPSLGEWFILRSEDSSYFSFPFGTNGDIPAPADFDGDGKTDVTVFRPSSGTWFILNSGGSGVSIVNFGITGDKPVTADYDGDGKADIAIFRPSDGSWWYLRSSDSQYRVFRFGVSADKPVQGDFTGDGKADIAVWRPSTGEWFVQRSEDNSFYSVPFGASGDIPAPGDYDGDGKFDTAVFRPSTSTWFVNRTTSGILIQGFGQNGDKPVPSAFVP